MDKANLLYRIIEIIIFLIPIGSLVWKAAKQSTRIDEMKKQIEILEARVTTNEKETTKNISEIKDSINKINVSNAEILTSLSFICEQIKEVKKEK